MTATTTTTTTATTIVQPSFEYYFVALASSIGPTVRTKSPTVALAIEIAMQQDQEKLLETLILRLFPQ